MKYQLAAGPQRKEILQSPTQYDKQADNSTLSMVQLAENTQEYIPSVPTEGKKGADGAVADSKAAVVYSGIRENG